MELNEREESRASVLCLSQQLCGFLFSLCKTGAGNVMFVGDVFAGDCSCVCKDVTFLPSNMEQETWSCASGEP